MLGTPRAVICKVRSIIGGDPRVCWYVCYTPYFRILRIFVETTEANDYSPQLFTPKKHSTVIGLFTRTEAWP
jgi:hypothetical protein